MKDAWDRVERELARRKLGQQWLADKLGYTIQRVQNWKTRGIPKSAFPEVAAALNESADWVAGTAEPKWKQPAAVEAPGSGPETVAAAHPAERPRTFADLDDKEGHLVMTYRWLRTRGRASAPHSDLLTHLLADLLSLPDDQREAFVTETIARAAEVRFGIPEQAADITGAVGAALQPSPPHQPAAKKAHREAQRAAAGRKPSRSDES
jgi:hypothetical protein